MDRRWFLLVNRSYNDIILDSQDTMVDSRIVPSRGHLLFRHLLSDVDVLELRQLYSSEILYTIHIDVSDYDMMYQGLLRYKIHQHVSIMLLREVSLV